MVHELTEGEWRAAQRLSITEDNGRHLVRNADVPGTEPLGVMIPAGAWVLDLLDHLKVPRTKDDIRRRFRSSAVDGVLTRLHRNGIIFRDDDDEHSFLVEAAARAIARDAMRLATSVRVLSGDLREQLGASRAAAIRDIVRSVADQITELSVETSQAERRAVDGRMASMAESCVMLHLGCGKTLLDGWLNLDLVGGDIRADARKGLPIPDGTVRFIYSSHLLEHLTFPDEALAVLGEMHRVLAADGVLRIVVPDIEICLRAYADGDDEFFAERAKYWSWARDAETNLEHFLAYVGANRSPLDTYGHKYGYDFETLANLMRKAGFTGVRRSEFMESRHPELNVDDHSPATLKAAGGTLLSLFVEAQKAGSPSN